MQTQNPALADRFVPRSETLHMLGIKSPATLYSMIRDQGLPKPYEITRGRKGWSFAELQNWISERKRMARQPAPNSQLPAA